MEKLPIQTWEIWIGNYHLGQGSTPPDAPEKVAVIEATTFKLACVLYEHQSAIEHILKSCREGKGEDIHTGVWYYQPGRNANSWTGQYYQTEEQAWQSFPSYKRPIFQQNL
jgi:hypothetical protein